MARQQQRHNELQLEGERVRPNVPYAFSLGRSALGHRSRSQNHEDLALLEMFFTGRRGGTFVEMGALDGLEYSNTFAFEQALDWNGVLIEANPAACAQLFVNRPKARCICGGGGGAVWLRKQQGGWVHFSS